MSPPIRDGSGNSIGSIRLGDGSEISEVRTGAGDVLFSANAIPDSGVTHYEFEQSLVDSWGTNDANDNTSAGYSTTAQEGSYAKAFDGDNDSINTTISSIGSSEGEYTIAFWLYYRGSTSSFERFMGNYANTVDDIWIGNGGGGDIRFQDDEAADGSVVASGVLEMNTYIHVAMAVDSTGVEGYKNGSSVATGGSGRSAASSTGQAFVIGQDGNGNYADMIIDEWKYYDKRLSDSEVSSLYSTGSI
jgi:hypothetical protein